MAFPAGKASEAEAGKLPGSTPARNAASAKPAKSPSKTVTDHIPKVLVINERKPITDMINSYCQQYRDEFKVIVSNRPAQVLSILEQNDDLRLIVSDYQLIAANGADIFSRIRRINSSVQFIMIPGHETEELIHKTRRATFIHDLSKPFGLPELVKTIRDTLPSAVTLEDVLQLASAGAGAALVLLDNGSQRGEIIIRHGSLVHAETEEFEGEEAFYQIASWKAFEFTLSDPPHDHLPTISLTLPQLWAEAAARGARTSADSEAFVPDPSPAELDAQPDSSEEVGQASVTLTPETESYVQTTEEDLGSTEENELFDPELLTRQEGDPVEERAGFNPETAYLDDDLSSDLHSSPAAADETLHDQPDLDYGLLEREPSVRKREALADELRSSTEKLDDLGLDSSLLTGKDSPAFPESLPDQTAEDAGSTSAPSESILSEAAAEISPRAETEEEPYPADAEQAAAPTSFRAFNLTDGIERLTCGDLGVEDLDAEACVEYHLRDFLPQDRIRISELPVSGLMGLLRRHIAFRLHWIALSTFRFEDTPFNMDDPAVTKASIELLQALFDSWVISREEYREMLWDAAIFQLSRSLNPCRTIAQYLYSHCEGKLYRIRAMFDTMIERKVIEADHVILNKAFEAYEKQTFRRAVIPTSQIENALLKHFHDHETDILWIEMPLAIQRMLEINAFGRTEAPVSIKQQLLVEMLQNRGLKDAAIFFKNTIPDESAGISLSVYQQMLLYFRD